ncbi:MAG TPA: class I SAM-dependent methyltransferase [Acetobacteraceae bacterium]|jgi:SAM-dependent methyltransferase|nr:class I SAM-dependent methyltransferase [Acetobacteraceae bacterium]
MVTNIDGPRADFFELPCVNEPLSVDDVEETGYLAANPDVRRSGISARQHFLTEGSAQQRSQWINLPQVTELRKRKLERIAFSREPEHVRRPDEAPNFLSRRLIEEFGIPEDPPVSAHPYGAPVLDVVRNNPDKLMLDVGAGLRRIYYANVVNTDIYASVSTDVICIAEDLPFADSQFDGVFCFATLEHTRRPWDVASEICRVLKPGGTIMIDYPFMQPVHGYPHHYFNATPLGNRSLFEAACDIQSVEIGWHQHPIVGLQWMLTVFRNGLPPDEARSFENLRIGDLLDRPVLTLLEASYSRLLAPQMQEVIATGSMLIGVKKQPERTGA